jgi:hypothetical protein
MAKIEFTIPELYKMAFGYTGLPFPLGDLRINLPDVAGIGKSIFGKNDFFGTPFFMPIQLNGVWIPNSPTMSLKAGKNIKSTPTAGGDVTIKELISINDYKLQIKGFAINFENNDYPYEDVEQLKELYAPNKSLPILSDLCEIFEINNVVVVDLDLPELVGIQNVQPFVLDLLSDNDFDVIVE